MWNNLCLISEQPLLPQVVFEMKPMVKKNKKRGKMVLVRTDSMTRVFKICVGNLDAPRLFTF
jgi:hypothetical protein